MSGRKRMGCSSWKDSVSRGLKGVSEDALREEPVGSH